MKLYISYFYNIRFFPENLLPVSTAAWDPKWFHNFEHDNYQFKDKRGVINGVRLPEFAPLDIFDENTDCPPKGTKCEHEPNTCNFLKKYYNNLKTLDFDKLYDKLQRMSKHYGTEDICFLVYEKPDNPCSERGPLCKWFKENGIVIKEWDKNCLD